MQDISTDDVEDKHVQHFSKIFVHANESLNLVHGSIIVKGKQVIMNVKMW